MVSLQSRTNFFALAVYDLLGHVPQLPATWARLSQQLVQPPTGTLFFSPFLYSPHCVLDSRPLFHRSVFLFVCFASSPLAIFSSDKMYSPSNTTDSPSSNPRRWLSIWRKNILEIICFPVLTFTLTRQDNVGCPRVFPQNASNFLLRLHSFQTFTGERNRSSEMRWILPGWCALGKWLCCPVRYAVLQFLKSPLFSQGASHFSFIFTREFLIRCV